MSARGAKRGQAALAPAALAAFLEETHACYNTAEFRRTDPVAFLHAYQDPRDREVAGLVAALLAYGRLQTIMAKVPQALDRLGRGPADFVLGRAAERLEVRRPRVEMRITEPETRAVGWLASDDGSDPLAAGHRRRRLIFHKGSSVARRVAVWQPTSASR